MLSHTIARSWRSAAALGLLAASCTSLQVGAPTLDLDSDVRSATGARGAAVMRRTPNQDFVTIDEAADELANADVVFLGEQHDSAECHAVQLALTRALAERRDEVIVSLEMFERDAQRRLDLYLDGAIDEEMFLAGARPWSNYEEHYRGVVEFARENDYDVLAANVYRPIASRVARGGLAAGVGDAWAARSIDVSDGEYRRLFNEIMTGGGHGSMDMSALDDIYAAQCIKDDTMAESIADALAEAGDDAPLVVHWNGRFHSDYGLGTVERLRRRRPDLNLAVVSMIATPDLGRALEGDEVDLGHFVILVPPTE
ncbi:MAG: ChaN family lipoprotein [Planctomycetota bacterium]